jgi:uncharacterized protein
MREEFHAETGRAAAFFDRIAPSYRADYADELDRKPFDREFLARAAGRLAGGLPVLEVGAGPAHIGAFLAGRGVRVVASDVSAGQLAQARIGAPGLPLIAADLASLPVRAGALGGVVGFYCLIYGPPDPLDQVFAGWQRALRAGGLAVVAVHAGTGAVGDGDVTVVLRQPSDLTGRLTAAGFEVEECTVRPPYQKEWPTERMYVVARA